MTTLMYSIEIYNKAFIITAENIEQATEKYQKMFPKIDIANYQIREHNEGVKIYVGGGDCYQCRDGVTSMCNCSKQLSCCSINSITTRIF